MKKKILFGTTLSIFLLLSAIWMTPLEAKTVEIQSNVSAEEKVSEKINALSIKLKDDPDLKNLISLHDNLEIRSIIQQVLDDENNKQIDELADDYINVLSESKKLDQLIDLLQSISNKYESDFLEIEQLSQDCKDTDIESDLDNAYNCYIEGTKEGAKVTRKEEYTPTNNVIVMRGEDLSVKIPGFELIHQNSLKDLAYFFWELYETLRDLGWACVAVADVFGILGLIFFWKPASSNLFFQLFSFFGKLGVVIMIGGEICRGIYLILIKISKLVDQTTDETHKISYRCNFLSKMKSIKLFLKYDLPLFTFVQKLPAYQ